MAAGQHRGHLFAASLIYGIQRRCSPPANVVCKYSQSREISKEAEEMEQAGIPIEAMWEAGLLSGREGIALHRIDYR